MTIAELVDLVAAVQFRRGWRLSAQVTELKPRYLMGQSGVKLTVTADVDDAYHEHALGHPPIRVASDVIWPVEQVAGMEEAEAIMRIWVFVREADEHEAREWFRVRGVRVMNPHP